MNAAQRISLAVDDDEPTIRTFIGRAPMLSAEPRTVIHRMPRAVRAPAPSTSAPRVSGWAALAALMGAK